MGQNSKDMRLKYFLSLTAVSACWSGFDNAITDFTDFTEILTLTKFFTREWRAYGSDQGETVHWTDGISTEDLIDLKNDLTSLAYQIFRYVDRLTDYMDDITATSCRIDLIKNGTERIDELLVDIPFTNQTYELGFQNRTITIPLLSVNPCNFDSTPIMEQAIKITKFVEWVDDQFAFIELFWQVYGPVLKLFPV